MYKIGDYIIYKKDVCQIKNIKENYINNLDYYILNPIDDDSLTINVPIQEKNALRDLITKQELEEIILDIPKITIIDCPDKFLEAEYKTLLQSSEHRNYIKIIKTREQDILDFGIYMNSYLKRCLQILLFFSILFQGMIKLLFCLNHKKTIKT